MHTSDIRHKPGREMVVADMLSRPPSVPLGKAYELEPSEIKYVPPEVTLAALEQVSLQMMSPAVLAKSQQADPDVAAHRKGALPKNVVMGEVDMSGHKIYCEVSDPNNPRPFLPKPNRELILNLFHHGDHPSKKETARRTCKEYSRILT